MDNPGAQVEQAVDAVSEIAQTWLAWDGRPCMSDDGRAASTRRTRRSAGSPTTSSTTLPRSRRSWPASRRFPDGWHASLATFESDWARFTEQDLVEAQQRLRRLGQTFALRIQAAGPDEWDRPRTPNWTLREICEHLTGVLWYAEQVGRLPR